MMKKAPDQIRRMGDQAFSMVKVNLGASETYRRSNM